jgi:enamine deaminase RidA (YjgF/YER057c/UK114 family)
LATAQPTADAIDRDVREYSLDPSNPDPAWFATLRAEHLRQTVLIVGHFNTIEPLIRGLGVSGEFPIGEQEFYRLFIVTTGDGGSSVSRLTYGEGSSERQRSLRSTGKKPDDTLKEIAKKLGHEPAVPPSGVEFEFVPVRQVGNLLYLSGNLPFNGKEVLRNEHKGKVGGKKGISVDEAREAAQFTTLNLLNDAQKHLGSLSRVVSVVEVLGMVNSAKGFTNNSKVVDGCSELLLEVFGEQVGSHTRCAIGVAELPLDACVEIKVILQVADED